MKSLRRDDRLHVHSMARIETHVVHPAECGGVLVLSSDRALQGLDFNLAGLPRQPLPADVTSLDGMQSMEHADSEDAAGSHPGASGHIANSRDLERSSDARQGHRLANQFVRKIFDALDDLGARIRDAKVALETTVDRHIDVPLNRNTQHGTELVLVECGQVSTAASETDSIGCLRDDHERRRNRRSSQTIPASCRVAVNGLRPQIDRADADTLRAGVSTFVCNIRRPKR